MATATTTRRALLGAIATVPAISLLGTPAISHSGDADLIAIWNVRQHALAVIESRGTYFDAPTHSPAETVIHDEAELRILASEARTARGALIQAWVTFSYIGEAFHEHDRHLHDLIRRADFAALERERELDCEYEGMVSLIRTLRLLAGEA